MGYTPLDFLKDVLPGMEEEGFGQGDSYAYMIKEYAELGITLPDTEDEYLDFVLSADFINPSYDGKYKAFNKEVINRIPAYLNIMGFNNEKMFQNDFTKFWTEMRDAYAAYIIFDKWIRNKQVYKIDGVFARFLTDTEKFKLTRQQMEHFPVMDFYIDLEDCTFNISGGFVHIHRLSYNDIIFIICFLDTNLLFYSNYIYARFNDKDELEFDGFLRDLRKNNPAIMPLTKLLKPEAKTAPTKDEFQKAMILTMQLLCYMTVKDPDINEDPITKSSYRPSKRIRNKFSEVQRYEVGIRIGSAITDKIKRVEKEIEKTNKENTGEENTAKENTQSEKRRKPPRPYFRSAHWHHYWTGKGRTVYEVRWLEPVFCAGTGNTAQDVVIHPVRINPDNQ